MAYTTINKSTDYFNTKLYTGNGAAARGITGVGFQPDWVWVKARSVGYPHITWDSARTNKASLCTNTTAAEVTTTARTLTSFDSDGFTTPNVTGDIFNDSGTDFASWNWKANGTGSANTDGSISSTVSANTTSGFSIVSYTGTGANATVGHGLGSLCKWIIIKRLNGTNNWEIGNTAMGWGKHIYFTTTAELTNSNRFQDTAPTNSLFYIGTGEGVNASGGNYIAYCFAEKQGYSKFGSYTGNGSTDGTFVYTGFKPAFLMAKTINAVDDWQMLDNKRNGFNPNNFQLVANSNNAEQTSGNRADFLSNGFKIRTSGGSWNPSGGAILYMAFAEAPLVGSNNVPATAR
jgi:hypothetical protein